MGFTRGAHVSLLGGSGSYVIRDVDGASVVCRHTPADDELLPESDAVAQLNTDCDSSLAARAACPAIPPDALA